MENFIILAILIVVVGAAILYIYKEKKKGRKCIGCPYSGCKSCSCKNSQIWN